MENSKAKEVILKYSDKVCSNHSFQDKEKIAIDEALYMVVEALEKQIPQKTVYGYDEQDDIKRSHCGEVVGMMDEYYHGNDKYCCNCGQALDWSDINER